MKIDSIECRRSDYNIFSELEVTGVFDNFEEMGMFISILKQFSYKWGVYVVTSFNLMGSSNSEELQKYAQDEKFPDLFSYHFSICGFVNMNFNASPKNVQRLLTLGNKDAEELEYKPLNALMP